MKKEPGDTNVSDAAQHWRRKRSDELEVEEPYVTEENCKLFLK